MTEARQPTRRRGPSRPSADREAPTERPGPEFDKAGDEPANERWRALLAEGGRVLDEIVKRVAPDAYPLPTEWRVPG